MTRGTRGTVAGGTRRRQDRAGDDQAARLVDVDELAQSIYESVLLSVRRLKQIPTGAEMSASEQTVLGRLARLGPTTAAELARGEHVTAQAMAVTLAALAERELIDRRPDPFDRRRSIVSVSARGEEGRRLRRDARFHHLRGVLAEFSPAELEQLAAAAPVLQRLGESL